MEHARTSIVATVGPACATHEVLTAMSRAGADVFRVNGAHAEPGQLAVWVRRVRRAARAAGREAAVMVDLPGIKLRTGTLRAGESLSLRAGTRVTLFGGRAGATAERIPVHPWPSLGGVRKGFGVLLDDGRMSLRVLRRRADTLECEVLEGGVLRAGKGVAFPGLPLALEVPTGRDRVLARAALAAGADWLGLSFVGSAADVQRLRRLTARAGHVDVPICAKVERADAFPNLAAILQASDAVIVARGDLGVDVGGENVPALQKDILEAARRAGIPAIIATEMLDSMTERTRPTRAEVSDVAGAVFEGTDGVLLSGETAVGAHPALAVETLDRILRSAEADDHAPYAGDARLEVPVVGGGDPARHVVRAAVLLAEEARARAIVVFTRTGASAVRLAKERPRARIHAFSPRAEVCRRLTLVWGVRPRRLPAGASTDAVVARVARGLRQQGLLAHGERAVLLMGGPGDPAGATTLIQLLGA